MRYVVALVIAAGVLAGSAALIGGTTSTPALACDPKVERC